MDDERDPLTHSFPSNSKTQRLEDPRRETLKDHKVEKIISGIAIKQKRSFLKKVSDLIMADDTQSVGSYIFNDVLIPAAKDMINDMVTGGMEMMLFGDRQGRSRGRNYHRDSYRGQNINYGMISRSSDRSDPRDRGREMSQNARARHDFDEILLQTRGEAEDVLFHLSDLIIDYQQATVADLYTLVGIQPAFTDGKYGWYDLQGVSPRRVRDGYILDLPRPRPLD